ncbi:unnamed protein product, partial [Ascophyllum nodosum]
MMPAVIDRFGNQTTRPRGPRVWSHVALEVQLLARVCTQSTAVPPRPPCNYCSELTGELAEAKSRLVIYERLLGNQQRVI